MYVLDVSTSSRALLTYSNGLHLVAADHSVQYQTKLDGVWTTTVEKADAGTLDRGLGSAVFPQDTKQQPSECRLCSCILTMENSPQQAFRGTPGMTSLILYSIVSKVYSG